MDLLKKYPVVPIPPTYAPNGHMAPNVVVDYLKYLYENGARVAMATAGTSQYNLLSPQEIMDFCVAVAYFEGLSILTVPPIHLEAACQFVKDINQLASKNIALMTVYPDRLYGHGSDVVRYHHTLADMSDVPVYVHGLPIRSGYGMHSIDYDASLWKRIAFHPNIVGCKEETSNLGKAFSAVNELPGFTQIVSGGSMRRFMFLRAAGATTFLSGVGNIWPIVENKFMKCTTTQGVEHIISTFETPFFNVAMKMGWHVALRESLRIIGFPMGRREPFPQTSLLEKHDLKECIETLDQLVKEL